MLRLVLHRSFTGTASSRKIACISNLIIKAVSLNYDYMSCLINIVELNNDN